MSSSDTSKRSIFKPNGSEQKKSQEETNSPPSTNTTPSPLHPSKPKDPNVMDVNIIRVGKLTPEERKCCIKKGLCFRCRKAGHLSRECPSFLNNKPGQQAKRVVREEEVPNLREVDNDNKETVQRISFTPMDF